MDRRPRHGHPVGADRGFLLTVDPDRRRGHASFDETFRALFDELHREIHAYASRRVPESIAEDVVAETFLTVWRRRRDLPASHEDRRRWVFGVARNHLAHAQRGRARLVRLESRLALATAAGIPVVEPDVAEEVVVSIAAFAAFRGLSPQDQEVIQLVAWDGLSVADCAAVLGCSPVAFEARLRRARRRLTARLRHHGLAESEPVGPPIGARPAGRLTLVPTPTPTQGLPAVPPPPPPPPGRPTRGGDDGVL